MMSDPAGGRPLAPRVPRASARRLLDEPRPGAPRRLTDAMIERAITETLETTPRWRIRRHATRGLSNLSGEKLSISRTVDSDATHDHFWTGDATVTRLQTVGSLPTQ
jgi:hypothetical protein